MLAAKRAAAASRALGMLQVQVDAERTARAPSSVVVEPPPATISKPEPAPKPQAPAAQPPSAPAAQPPARTPAVSEPTQSAPPLLEVKTSPLGADLEHLGDRFAIFVDRVELRDRLDRVRNSIKGTDIVDVVVHKRLTGAVLDRRERPRAGYRREGPAPGSGRRSSPAHLRQDATAPEGPTATATKKSSRTRPRHRTEQQRRSRRHRRSMPSRCASKLADLHDAGVLTDDEYRQKLLVVRRLASGETSEPRRDR